MSKKILLVSVVILALTVALTACKGKQYEKEPSTTENTDKVVQTVPITNKDGGTTNVEVFEDQSGDRYITNVDGDKIPLTTDGDGFSDDIGYLVTSKPAQTNPSNTEKNTGNSSKPTESTPSSEQEKTSSSSTSTKPESSTGGGIVIDSKVEQDSILWDDIKNPKK